MKRYSTLDDQQLLVLLQDGDHAAFTEIYQRYWHVLFLHSYRILQNEDAAKDIIQDLFTTLWNTPDLSNVISLKAYLYSMARNHTLNSIHREKVRERYFDSLCKFIERDSSFTEEQVRFKELSDLIDEGIMELPPKMQEIFRMSRVDGAAHRTIAVELGISENTVKSTINRALKVLRSKLSSMLIFFF